MVVIDVLTIREFGVFTNTKTYMDNYLENLFTTFQAIFPNNTN